MIKLLRKLQLTATDWVNVCSIFVVVLVTYVEAPLVEASGQQPYVSSRILIALGFVGLLCARSRANTVAYGVAWATLFYCYSIVGEYYRPLYVIAILQIQILHATYFAHGRFSFQWTHLLGSGVFVFTMAQAWESNLQRLGHSSIEDQVTIAVCSLITSMLLHFHMEKKKATAEVVTKKLALVGTYATSLIHDLKNLSAAPLLYTELLSKRAELTPAEVDDVTRMLGTELGKLQSLVTELYSCAKLSEQEFDDCSLAQIVKVAVDLMGARIANIECVVRGEAVVKTDRRVLQVILLNLFYNAVTALKSSSEGKKVILVDIRESELEFSSSTGGPAPAESSPGLGLFLMEELSRGTNIRLTQDSTVERWVTRLQFT